MARNKEPQEPQAPSLQKIRQRCRVPGGLGGDHYEFRVLVHPDPDILTDWEPVPDDTPEHDWRPA